VQAIPGSAQAYALEAVVGFAAGSFVAIAVSVFAKRQLRLLQCGLLGAIGFVGAVVGLTYLPWRVNTVSYRVGDTVMHTTKNRIQHPYEVAIVFAVLLPAIYEFFRRKKSPERQ
jgi:hypothetical protein